MSMEQINIFSGKRVISRIITSEDMKGLGRCLGPFRSIFVVADRSVAEHCPAVASFLSDTLTVQLPDNSERRLPNDPVAHRSNAAGRVWAKVKLIDASEQNKTVGTVMSICSWLLEEGADRDALLLAIGGGITTDMAGFAASIYKRGVRFAYVPTTLLSQVDAAIGGKTGVNFEKYKNILGVIRQPEFTYICPQVLESLPRRDFLSGAAEMLKTFMIEDGGNYEKAAEMLFDMSGEFHVEAMIYGKDATKVWQDIVRKQRKKLSALIAEAARVKAGIVSRDQFERGERRKLNLGHTFAHAIETLAQRDCGARFDCGDGSSGVTCSGNSTETAAVTHGEAVAMGLVLAARLADRYYRKDLGDPTPLEGKISSDLWDSDIACYCPYSLEEMAQVMKKDKKAEGGKIHFVLLKAVGEVEIVNLTVEEVCSLMS